MQVKNAPDEIQDYLRDTSNMPGGHAERLVMPASIEEVQAVLREANEKKISYHGSIVVHRPRQ